MILVGAEVDGRIRMQRIPDASAASLGPAVQAMTIAGADLATDLHRGYTAAVVVDRTHHADPSPRTDDDHDPVQWCHWAASNLKRWWLGTHHGAISGKHCSFYLDEFTFRYNRRKTNGIGRLVARALEMFGRVGKRTMRAIVDEHAITRIPAR